VLQFVSERRCNMKCETFVIEVWLKPNSPVRHALDARLTR
jgi:hypothetical protein